MRRQITETEKLSLLAQYRRPDGTVHCFVDDEPISNERDIHFDHIDPFARVEETELANIAPVCRNHNLAKKDMTLSEYRDKLKMEKFFLDFESQGKQAKLNDVLVFRFGLDYGWPVQYQPNLNNQSVMVKFYGDKSHIKPPDLRTYTLYKCPVTGMQYFYGLIPSRNILNDGKDESVLELQPRPLVAEHMWDLYRHLRVNTQLQPSICRLADDAILVFDGQHKAAARIWAGAECIEAKVYVEPDVISLMRTNLVAHDKLKQLRFYSSILADKMAQLYGVNWQRYVETDAKKSEKGFCTFIKYAEDKSDEQPIKQIEAFLMTSILSDPSNKLVPFIAPENKTGKQYAMSWDSMKKYYFRYFLTKPPLDVEFDSNDDFRNHEIRNNIRLLNLIADLTLINQWDPAAGDERHRKAERIYRSGAIMAWFPMLRDVVYNKLDLVSPEDAKLIFFRTIPEDKWSTIERFVKRMFSHPIWVEKDTNIDVVLGNKKHEYTQRLFHAKGFTTQWILGLTT